MAKAVLAAGGEIHFFEEGGWKAFYEDPMDTGPHWQGGLMMPEYFERGGSYHPHAPLQPPCPGRRHPGPEGGSGLLANGHPPGIPSGCLHPAGEDGRSQHRPTLVKKQRLVISAADKILTTIGPDTGHVYQPDIGLIIASESVVAHDMVSLAWLLENRRHIPSDQKGGFADTSPIVAWLANYWVVQKLGGWKPTLCRRQVD